MTDFGPLLVILLHAGALGAAYLTLHLLHEQAWYWHVAAVAAAVWIGVTRMPENFSAPSVDLINSLAFSFLLLWGVAGPVFHCERNGKKEKHA